MVHARGKGFKGSTLGPVRRRKTLHACPPGLEDVCQGELGSGRAPKTKGGPWVGLAERGERLERGNTGEPQTHSRQAEVMGQDRKVGDTEAILQEEWGLPSCSSG